MSVDLLDGVTVGGRKISDQEQVLNLAESSRRLLAMVRSGQFELSKPVFTELNGIDAISVPAAKVQEFNEKMVDFYLSRDATAMMAFLVACHPG